MFCLHQKSCSSDADTTVWTTKILIPNRGSVLVLKIRITCCVDKINCENKFAIKKHGKLFASIKIV